VFSQHAELRVQRPGRADAGGRRGGRVLQLDGGHQPETRRSRGEQRSQGQGHEVTGSQGESRVRGHEVSSQRLVGHEVRVRRSRDPNPVGG